MKKQRLTTMTYITTVDTVDTPKGCIGICIDVTSADYPVTLQFPKFNVRWDRGKRTWRSVFKPGELKPLTEMNLGDYL